MALLRRLDNFNEFPTFSNVIITKYIATMILRAVDFVFFFSNYYANYRFFCRTNTTNSIKILRQQRLLTTIYTHTHTYIYLKKCYILIKTAVASLRIYIAAQTYRFYVYFYFVVRSLLNKSRVSLMVTRAFIKHFISTRRESGVIIRGRGIYIMKII